MGVGAGSVRQAVQRCGAWITSKSCSTSDPASLLKMYVAPSLPQRNQSTGPAQRARTMAVDREVFHSWDSYQRHPLYAYMRIMDESVLNAVALHKGLTVSSRALRCRQPLRDGADRDGWMDGAQRQCGNAWLLCGKGQVWPK